jgi:Amt family ammonium transporter
MIFVLLWGTFVYDPIAHWVWGGGYIGGGSIDLDPGAPSYFLWLGFLLIFKKL